MSAIWIDLENTPHVPFFAPIIRRLRTDGFEVILTARDFAQTLDLLERHDLTAFVVGGESGASSIRKGIGLLTRALALRRHLAGRQIDLAVGHGSRGLVVAAKLLRVPSLTLYDYEGASVALFNRLSSKVMTPEVVGRGLIEKKLVNPAKLLSYPGMKEDVYVVDFVPERGLPDELGLDLSRIIVTVRPPSETAHYRSDESRMLFELSMELLLSHPDVQLVISARTKDQRATLQRTYGTRPSVIIPTEAFDGLSLLYYSDLLIGGGGTMNREAAALGVPVITIFKGEMGAIDAELIRTGRMSGMSEPSQLLPFLKKRERAVEAMKHPEVLSTIVNAIERIAGG